MKDNSTTTTLVDRIIASFRNHPLAALLIVAAVAVIGLGQVAGAWESIRGFLGRDESRERTYSRLRFDLKRLDRTLDYVVNPPDDCGLSCGEIAAREEAATVCAYRQTLAEFDDGLGVRMAERSCSILSAYRAADTTFATLRNRRGTLTRKDSVGLAMLVSLAGHTFQSFLWDSAAHLVLARGETRRQPAPPSWLHR